MLMEGLTFLYLQNMLDLCDFKLRSGMEIKTSLPACCRKTSKIYQKVILLTKYYIDIVLASKSSVGQVH